MSSEVGYTGGEIKDPDYRRARSVPAVLSSQTVCFHCDVGGAVDFVASFIYIS